MTPEWARELPDHIVLSAYQVERLEIIRAALGVSEFEFRVHISTNLECGKMLQRREYGRLERERPGLKPEMYFVLLILMRLAAARIAGGDLFDLCTNFGDSLADDDPRLLDAIFGIILKHDVHDVDRLAVVIREYEDTLPHVPAHPSTAEARRQITLILAEGNRQSPPPGIESSPTQLDHGPPLNSPAEAVNMKLILQGILNAAIRPAASYAHIREVVEAVSEHGLSEAQAIYEQRASRLRESGLLLPTFEELMAGAEGFVPDEP